MENTSLTRFAWLSIATAIITISLKAATYFLTGSVGFLSDAIESLVNLAAAIIALVALKLAEKPADEHHAYGHSKAEYFSSSIEGVLIFIAAIGIGTTAIQRIMNPQPLENVALGLAVSVAASAVNLFTARKLLIAGKKFHSITLEADGHHILTDVWTSAGVIIGVGLVSLTGIAVLDPIIALAVAVNILYTGFTLVKRSALGLVDSAIPEEEIASIKNIFDAYTKQGIEFHALRTRQSASRRFVSVHILFPQEWNIQRCHDLSEDIEDKIRQSIPNVTIDTHLEPLGDEKSLADISLDRKKIS